ncbi:F-box protein SKIP22-like [Syzygium oleosum]|uniref:F-box protein SKIP22-like n=1 Tax=Syzygium oleosum TaxID=219896 RepID=UPI0024BBB766|nr:F-box protein SKIP22-like [Syzygium oleosum]
MTDLVPGDGQKKADAPTSAEGRRNSSSGSVDLDGAADGSAVVRGKFSEPYVLLRRILREELGGGGGDGGGHRLLVAAVHAVMQESGFVAVDPATRMPADQRPPSTAFAMSLWYSLPELVAREQGLNMSERVLLKFQSLGHFITVYGILAKAKLGLRRVCLDERRFAPAIDLIRAKGDDDDDEVEANEDGGSSTSYPLKEVFEFSMLVKDGLALPLLIDLAERAGLPVPSCFAHLPAELKLKIFESLPGIGLARVGCACSELRDLTSNDDLWEQKYVEEFGGRTAKGGGMFNWKQRFARSWTAKKKRRRRAIGFRHLRYWTGLPLVEFEGVSVPYCLRNYRR